MVNINTWNVDSNAVVQFWVFPHDYRRRLAKYPTLDMTDEKLSPQPEWRDRNTDEEWHYVIDGSHLSPAVFVPTDWAASAAVMAFAKGELAKLNKIKLRHRIDRRVGLGEGVTHFWLPLDHYMLLRLALSADYHFDRRHPDHVTPPGRAN